MYYKDEDQLLARHNIRELTNELPKVTLYSLELPQKVYLLFLRVKNLDQFC